MAFLGGDKGKAFRQVKAHLIAEYAARAGSGAVFLVSAVLQHMLHEVEILFHSFQNSAIRASCQKTGVI